MFINPDLTLYIEREPVGEWICLEAHDADRRRRRRARPRASSTTSAAASAARCSRSLVAAALSGAGAGYFSRKALMRTSYCCASRA